MAREGRRIVREAILYGKLLFGDPEVIRAASRYLKSEKFYSSETHEGWEGK